MDLPVSSDPVLKSLNMLECMHNGLLAKKGHRSKLIFRRKCLQGRNFDFCYYAEKFLTSANI